MKKIKTVRLFSNHTKKSLLLEKKLRRLLPKYSLIEDLQNYDLGIAIGGDGAFLRMLKKSSFNRQALYVGINTGTLGFAQEILPKNVESFLERISKGDYYQEEVTLLSIEIKTPYSISHFEAYNEITVREKELRTASLDLIIEGEVLETFHGDGLLVSSSNGSTAYNLSLGGSIIYPSIEALEITPMAPLNSRSYRNILHSLIIPIELPITIKPQKERSDLLLSIDGENYRYQEVEEINVQVSKDAIKLVRLEENHFVRRIREKFLQD